jgi:hypothetical protein
VNLTYVLSCGLLAEGVACTWILVLCANLQPLCLFAGHQLVSFVTWWVDYQASQQMHLCTRSLACFMGMIWWALRDAASAYMHPELASLDASLLCHA